ncbi:MULTISPECIES: alcohol dehydrogenase [Paraburkholderia]|jgi:D-arabinose 1-dehydrogenase-like Zn-dependent alcohol dehydrogenase|uniref:Alcohol dehydrogenase n=1 Tax=Paraburkholderia largidicola TaxID=3014751 RepID=A0A7I8BZJ9_9BURK|nr:MULTISPECIES: alcohol dehydrogenase [Paraburkholderia]BEU27024.1 alcohol dehydrogenase [Paraburkholderia sp. 22B1P]GJH32151.1 alcohol dehydrogenase catalytic domain-containing protein [Paraburkholderia hospita]CAG9264271.1 Alcohol dehydrogenase [Paraburkholderia caribensis]BCF93845.1 alcohol dehydrogenase [Paraburkholderia sp. PGU16]GJH00327.1 alcohol dehydrogenase catalytic domain-containing protein [Paraburkholderia terrae]
MRKMRAVQVSGPGGALELVERDVPAPGAGQVLIKVQACGICHSDSLTKEGQWPGLQYPRVPGHEVAGVIDTVGAGVEGWKAGERVGVGWHGGHCGHCANCRRGYFVVCEKGQVPGISYDGGYADYLVAPVEALARMPEELNDVDAAPLLCAGITTFNALRNSGARAGEVVAILGIGGLGHLGVQFARRMGFNTVAIARGEDKAPLAKQLGAHHYIDSRAQNPADALKALGGASVILATVTNADAMTATLGGLALNGKLIILGVADKPIEVPPVQFIMGRNAVQGWPSGSSADSEDTLAFSALADVKPMIETYPIERAAEAYDRMMSGAARFRVVLTMN